VWNLNPQRWGSALVQEKYREEMISYRRHEDDDDNDDDGDYDNDNDDGDDDNDDDDDDDGNNNTEFQREIFKERDRLEDVAADR